MTTYAALISLMNLLDRIQHPTCPYTFDVSKTQPVFVKVSILVKLFVEKYRSKHFVALEREMADAAYEVEDIIESYVLAQTYPTTPTETDVHVRRQTDLELEALDNVGAAYVVEEVRFELKALRQARQRVFSRRAGYTNPLTRYSGCKSKVYALFCADLDNVEREMDLIIQKAMEVKVTGDELSRSYVPVDPSMGEIKMVGFDQHLSRLMEQLYTKQSKLEILPVVGMGGIGKSTLARSLYNNQYSKHHFDVRAWATISQEYTHGTIVRSLLKDIGVSVTGQQGDKQLEDQLYKYLFQRKYLIVLDDIWSSLAWDGVRRFLPDNKNGSRVLLTTRLMNVAVSVGSCRPYELSLLDDDTSWKLLCETVFRGKNCPTELEKCGVRIAKSCKGLPLALVVVGGILKMSHKTLLDWLHVAENVTSLVSAGNNGHCRKILSLSYNQLPMHLKPCFLYMATFPEGCEIPSSDLVMVWVADGFLKPVSDNCLEDVASEYLDDLISRNLIIVKERNSMGKVKLLIMHDLVRDFCVKEAQEERFLTIITSHAPEKIKSRRIVNHVGTLSTRYTRSLISYQGGHALPPSSLLRVFISPMSYTFSYITQLVNSRFLEFSIRFVPTFAIFTKPLPWNLETLIVHDIPKGKCFTLPMEIWELPHLRHLIFRHEVLLPDCDSPAQTGLVLNNLQTLKTVVNFCFSNKVLNRIPNLRNLRVIYDHPAREGEFYFFGNVANCEKLETLTFDFRNIQTGGIHRCTLFDDLENLKLCANLRKLTLSHSFIPWERISTVSSLLYLEVLKLKHHATSGHKWNSVEGEFPSLKVLSIRCVELVLWTADHECSHFPRLEILSLRHMRKLKEFPVAALGEVTSLVSMELYECGESIIRTAKKILEEQQIQGNDELTIQATYVYEQGHEMTELGSLVDDKFHVKFVRTRDSIFTSWRNNQGCITTTKLLMAMRSLGHNPVEAELQDVINKLDGDDFKENREFMDRKRMRDTDSEEKLHLSGQDQNGFILGSEVDERIKEIQMLGEIKRYFQGQFYQGSTSGTWSP